MSYGDLTKFHTNAMTDLGGTYRLVESISLLFIFLEMQYAIGSFFILRVYIGFI